MRNFISKVEFYPLRSDDCGYTICEPLKEWPSPDYVKRFINIVDDVWKSSGSNYFCATKTLGTLNKDAHLMLCDVVESLKDYRNVEGKSIYFGFIVCAYMAFRDMGFKLCITDDLYWCRYVHTTELDFEYLLSDGVHKMPE